MTRSPNLVDKLSPDVTPRLELRNTKTLWVEQNIVFETFYNWYLLFAIAKTTLLNKTNVAFHLWHFVFLLQLFLIWQLWWIECFLRFHYQLYFFFTSFCAFIRCVFDIYPNCLYNPAINHIRKKTPIAATMYTCWYWSNCVNLLRLQPFPCFNWQTCQCNMIYQIFVNWSYCCILSIKTSRLLPICNVVSNH